MQSQGEANIYPAPPPVPYAASPQMFDMLPFFHQSFQGSFPLQGGLAVDDDKLHVGEIKNGGDNRDGHRIVHQVVAVETPQVCNAKRNWSAGIKLLISNVDV